MKSVAPSAFLKRINPDGSAAEAWAVGNKPLVVGRGDFADAFVEDDALSRSHFLIVREGVDLFLVDLDSRNGTWLNGEPVSAHKLHSNDIIHAGGSEFMFSVRAPAQMAPLMPILLLANSQAAESQLHRV